VRGRSKAVLPPRALIAELRCFQGSSIINISSTYGHEGAAGASVYAASKHAVEGLTKSAALEGAKSGVRINAVAPGPTDTGMLNRFTGSSERKAALTKTVPLGRVGDPAEIAHAPNSGCRWLMIFLPIGSTQTPCTLKWSTTVSQIDWGPALRRAKCMKPDAGWAVVRTASVATPASEGKSCALTTAKLKTCIN
jgi:hypothetical protein